MSQHLRIPSRGSRRLVPPTALLLAAACTLVTGVAVAAVHGSSGTEPLAATAASTSPTPTAPASSAAPALTTPPTASSAALPTTVAPAPSPAAADPAPAKAAPYLPLPAKAAQPEPCPPPKVSHPPASPPPSPAPPRVAEAAVPTVAAPAARTVSLDAISGKGMWLTPWPTSKVDVDGVVAKARAAGLHQLWVRTGGYRQGWYGDRVLRDLLPKAHAAGIKVIAWDFPDLSDPRADADRAAKALAYTSAGQRIDAFSPDLETKTEGVFLTDRRVAYYLSLVRRAAGDRAVVLTVPRLSIKGSAVWPYKYPYALAARWVDAFAPMVYWSCREPGLLVDQTLKMMAAMRPLHLIGQSYDMAPEGGRPGLPTAAETWVFLDRAWRGGAVGASLWTVEQAGPGQWEPLGHYPWKRR